MWREFRQALAPSPKTALTSTGIGRAGRFRGQRGHAEYPLGNSPRFGERVPAGLATCEYWRRGSPGRPGQQIDRPHVRAGAARAARGFICQYGQWRSGECGRPREHILRLLHMSRGHQSLRAHVVRHSGTVARCPPRTTAETRFVAATAHAPLPLPAGHTHLPPPPTNAGTGIWRSCHAPTPVSGMQAHSGKLRSCGQHFIAVAARAAASLRAKWLPFARR